MACATDPVAQADADTAARWMIAFYGSTPPMSRCLRPRAATTSTPSCGRCPARTMGRDGRPGRRRPARRRRAPRRSRWPPGWLPASVTTLTAASAHPGRHHRRRPHRPRRRGAHHLRPHTQRSSQCPSHFDAEYPLHQVPLSLAHVASTDRNAYDRSYFNAHNRTDELVSDHRLRRVSEPRDHRRARFAATRRPAERRPLLRRPAMTASTNAGAYRIEVIEPLRSLRADLRRPVAGPLVRPDVGGLVRTGRRAGPRCAHWPQGHPGRLPLRPGGDVAGNARHRRRRVRSRPRHLGRHPRPVVGASARLARPNPPANRPIRIQASIGSMCRCGSTTLRSS